MPGADHYRARGPEDPAARRGPHAHFRSLHIENLKSLGGSHEVELAPLTLIYGPNAAGKSTILQGLKLLADFVYGPLQYHRSKPDVFKEYPDHRAASSAGWVWQPWVCFDEGFVATFLPGPLVTGHNRDLVVEVSVDFAVPLSDFEYAALRLWAVGESLRPCAELRLGHDGRHVHVFSGEEDSPTSSTFERLERVVQRTLFLGPHREGRAQDDPYSEWLELHRLREERLPDAVNEWLERLEIPYRILPLNAHGMTPEEAEEENRRRWASESPSLAPVQSGTGWYFLTDVRSGVKVTLDQVGYGVSQALPIVQACVGNSAHVVCIEQPELHLHPRLQANLGALFVDAVQRGKQIIAETHSESLLLRIQRLIRQRRLQPENVAVIYVDNTPEEGVSIQRLELGSDGDLLDPWPTGFFDDQLDDILGILE